jgi:hypothetical protein
MSIGSFERYPLLFGPSPVHRLERLSAHLGGAPVWAKREDCNSGIAYGGNKTRKLRPASATRLYRPSRDRQPSQLRPSLACHSVTRSPSSPARSEHLPRRTVRVLPDFLSLSVRCPSRRAFWPTSGQLGVTGPREASAGASCRRLGVAGAGKRAVFGGEHGHHRSRRRARRRFPGQRERAGTLAPQGPGSRLGHQALPSPAPRGRSRCRARSRARSPAAGPGGKSQAPTGRAGRRRRRRAGW